jgi:hypothetical protein
VALDLKEQFGCKLTDVSQRVTEMVGRDLTEGGRKTDEERNVLYYDKLLVKKFRLRFRSGRVYRYEDRSRLPVRLVPLDSELFEQKDAEVEVKGAKRLRGWGPFVMTVEREFYMSKHYMPGENDPTQGIFHSAYSAAGAISFAGTMLVKNGQILGIRGDSGHYQPLLHNMTVALAALSMHSVPLQSIRVIDFNKDATDLGSAHEFIGSKLTWWEFEKAAKDFRRKRLDRIKAGKTYGTQIPAQGNQPTAPADDSDGPRTYIHSPR